MKFRFKTKIWLYPGAAAWHFVTLPKTLSERLRRKFAPFARGWGSLRVEAKIGKTTWESSIFPDKKRGAYLLPLKKEIRLKENLAAGDVVACTLAVRVVPI